MKIKVHMLAFEDAGTIREVTLPDDLVVSGEGELLEKVFYFGQNDFAIGPELNTACSVSVGDVVELSDRRLFVVAPCGFKQITTEQLIQLVVMPQRDRHFCDIVSGDTE
jgi:hypothetical protein